MKTWQYLVPKYGNFGGPGWSGGAMMDSYDEVDWSVKPMDSLDETFHCHDTGYQEAIEKEKNGDISYVEMRRKWVKADMELVARIKKIPADPRKWERKPVTCCKLYSWFYRKCALAVFSTKVFLHNLVHTSP